MTNFEQPLRDLRSARKLTQIRLAEPLQVSPRADCRWETGDGQKALLAVLDSLVNRTHISRVMAA